MKREELIEDLMSTALALGKLYDNMNKKGINGTTEQEWIMLGVLTNILHKDAKKLQDVEPRFKKKAA